MDGMCQFGGDGMRGWARLLGMVLAAGILVAGCKSTTNVSIVLTSDDGNGSGRQTTQFTATVSNGGAVNWSVNGVVNGNTTVGTISTAGLYTAPLSVPTTGSPPTPTPITVTATLQSDTSIVGSATVTLDSGVRVTITPTTFTLGTGETFQFSAVVTGVPTNASIVERVQCRFGASFVGAVLQLGDLEHFAHDECRRQFSTNGQYTAPPAGERPRIWSRPRLFSMPTRTASASVAIVVATPPTLTSVSPTDRGARRSVSGCLFDRDELPFHHQRVRHRPRQRHPASAQHGRPGSSAGPDDRRRRRRPGTLMHVRLPDVAHGDFAHAAGDGQRT